MFTNETTFHIIENVKQKKPIKSVNIDYIFQQIKTGGAFLDKITLALSAGQGSTLYDKIKLTLPAWLPNGRFNNNFRNQNLQSLTGLMFFDIDKLDSQEATL